MFIKYFSSNYFTHIVLEGWIKSAQRMMTWLQCMLLLEKSSKRLKINHNLQVSHQYKSKRPFLYSFSFSHESSVFILQIAQNIQQYINKLAKSQQSTMIEKPLQATFSFDNEARTHKKSDSNSTTESSIELRENSAKPNSKKQKSQLCKKFMESFCPYENRCKFAHGLDQLRTDNDYNSKYKTKECGSFKNSHFCIYGDRCNFIHETRQPQNQKDSTFCREKNSDIEMKVIRKMTQKDSKLLKLLFSRHQ